MVILTMGELLWLLQASASSREPNTRPAFPKWRWGSCLLRLLTDAHNLVDEFTDKQ
jgi:hypothetical protein